MATSIRGLVQRAQTILQDANGTRWDEAELLGWFNDGRRELSVYRPTEFARRTAVVLEAGTLQRLPVGAFLLLRVAANLRSTSPRIAGRVVTQVERRILDAMHPGWEDTEVFPEAAEVRHYCYDDNEPLAFSVFPANDGTGQVELLACFEPGTATSVDTATGVRDVFNNALLDYMLYRAFDKDSDHPGNAERSAKHYAAFTAAIGASSTTQGGVQE